MKKDVQYRLKIRQIAKDTRILFSKSIGVLFIFTALFSVFSNWIFFPVSRKLWSLSLLTVKEGYISDQNVMAIFTHPLVLLAGLFIVFGYCGISLIETAGIIMILEYSHRNHPVKLLSIIPVSCKQIKQCVYPKNWMIFVYLLIIQPFVDSDFAGQMISDITIPEFIDDYIYSRTSLSLLVAVVCIILLILFIRFLFLPIIMVLEKRDFSAAAKKSAAFLQGRAVSTYVKILLVTAVGSFIINFVPYTALYMMQNILTEYFSKYRFAQDVSAYVYDEVFVSALGSLKTIFIKILVMAVLLNIYHVFESQLEDESDISLPKECIKTEGKIYTFRRFIYALYLLIIAAASLLFVALTVIAETEPLTVTELITPTKIAAHKGYSSKAPENTLPAFEIAVNTDIVDYIELDVRETKDGVPVVIHDASIQAATGENILIYDIDYADLQKYSALYGHNEEEFLDTKFSSLDDVLNKYADKKNFIIEIKASDRTPELPGKIVALMDKYNITETSVIHSGSYESLKAVKEINPDILCGFIIAVSTGGYEDLPYADFFSVEHTYLSQNTISRIHKRGKKVYVWTVNEKSSFDQVRSMGADVVITDYPDDAYNGIHQYDSNIISKLSETFDVTDVDELKAIDYNGTGD